MPNSARKQSKTGVYHIIIRGINRQDIFHGLSIRQLERLTGINRGIIQKA